MFVLYVLPAWGSLGDCCCKWSHSERSDSASRTKIPAHANEWSPSRDQGRQHSRDISWLIRQKRSTAVESWPHHVEQSTPETPLLHPFLQVLRDDKNKQFLWYHISLTSAHFITYDTEFGWLVQVWTNKCNMWTEKKINITQFLPVSSLARGIWKTFENIGKLMKFSKQIFLRR